MTRNTRAGHARTLSLSGALVATAIALGGCNLTGDNIATGTVPDDYRQRHPIAVTEGEQSIVVFVGRARGNLTETQRDDVMGMARTWRRDGTGAIAIDVPADTSNARSAQAVYQEIRGVLASMGVPAHAIVRRSYRVDDPRALPTIRLSYSKMAAVAGPCGLWPSDLGPSIYNPSYNENKQWDNFGCATQHNLAAMVANPSDLVQPRTETASYTPRRSVAFQKYSKGESTATTYPEADRAKLSDAGK
ncbi:MULTISPECIES: CpaD family pilus assembly protein [unclassified Bradyrhizobium]|uniref:CpaD family pilus assembly protein n=1 Tax=unclassified Bradyrhizobium TaxID=2631580 RepID=UPI001BAE3CF7|nr:MULTISPECIES: CpaD family pilus assembly protein [unclassified Bradyrhizobium]MBR1206925.1 CpaD family pilus assembly protein [Bradyrhizobium sp. AUGA SZCCT0124]MBR1313464.1 CpaD family pilus assembly protein [Bradyrhizobium sp. AUGA SZCCT0051]MBR1343439.1 CpaD family pilus assembly protein [Bradyrhizobium sp. AUGA SZCCT0105]MBR1357141.1 CpaD family pilus assembly protein [Bradyrhizobium sp. AUGA SZCCT0045]